MVTSEARQTPRGARPNRLRFESARLTRGQPGGGAGRSLEGRGDPTPRGMTAARLDGAGTEFGLQHTSDPAWSPATFSPSLHGDAARCFVPRPGGGFPGDAVGGPFARRTPGHRFAAAGPGPTDPLAGHGAVGLPGNLRRLGKPWKSHQLAYSEDLRGNLPAPICV